MAVRLKRRPILTPRGWFVEEFSGRPSKGFEKQKIDFTLKREWDRMYPTNPVGGTDD